MYEYDFHKRMDELELKEWQDEWEIAACYLFTALFRGLLDPSKCITLC